MIFGELEEEGTIEGGEIAERGKQSYVESRRYLGKGVYVLFF